MQRLFEDPVKLVGGLTYTYLQRKVRSGDRPIDKWSLTNRLLCWLKGTEDARTYNQWKKADRAVKKGSKAFYLFAPRTVKVRDENGEEDGTLKVVGMAAFAVFAVEQTKGKALPPAPTYDPETLPPFWEVSQKWGINVKYRPGLRGQAVGTYHPGRKEIILVTHTEEIFFHELGHAADERAHGKLQGGQQALQEAVAEMVAAVLARMCGKCIDRHSWEYLSIYDKNPAALLKRVLPRVEAALDLIFEAA